MFNSVAGDSLGQRGSGDGRGDWSASDVGSESNFPHSIGQVAVAL